MRITARLAVCVQSQTYHCATVCAPCRTSIQELWREESDMRSFRGRR